MQRVTQPYNNIKDTGTRRTINWGFLLVGILFVGASVLSFINPAGSLESLAYVFAFLAIVNGVWLLANNLGSGWRIAGGIIDILIGLFLVSNIYYTMAALPYVFAVWFIVDSILRLATIGITRLLGTGFFVLSLIFNILGLIVGILLLFNPVVSALTLSFMVGFYLLLAGIESIALAFQR